MTIDHQLEQVREFHTAFNCTLFDKPTMLDLSDADKELIADLSRELAAIAARLKVQCAEVNELGRSALGLYLVRLQLGVEELGEVADAVAQGDLGKVLAELTDVGYVNTGTYLTFGLGDFKVQADRLIHSANMAKLDKDGNPIVGISGRVIKPEGWTKADVAGLLENPA